MMDLAAILRRIDQRIAALKTTDRAVSLRATNSADTIRNWRRRVAEGDGGGASTRTLTKVADALEVSPQWLINGTPTSAAGFAEAEVLPWAGGDDSSESEGPTASIVALLAPRARQPALYQLAKPAPLFALLAGDVIIIDLGRAPQDGDLALVRHTDPATGDDAVSTIMQKIGDFLVQSPAAGPGSMMRHDSNYVSIAGPVVASFRRR
jgi:hypothetical protein